MKELAQHGKLPKPLKNSNVEGTFSPPRLCVCCTLQTSSTTKKKINSDCSESFCVQSNHTNKVSTVISWYKQAATPVMWNRKLIQYTAVWLVVVAHVLKQDFVARQWTWGNLDLALSHLRLPSVCFLRSHRQRPRSDMPAPLMWQNNASIIHPITNFNLLPLCTASFWLWSLARCCLRSKKERLKTSNRRLLAQIFFSFLKMCSLF